MLGAILDQIHVFVDHREVKSRVPDMLKAREVVVELAQLPVGDFVVSDRVCIERKRREDFEQSIIDGRLFEQAGRLAEVYEKPIMIVEGQVYDERISKNAKLGAFCSLMLDFGINIFFTKDADSTVDMIIALAKREQITERRPVRLLGDKRARSLSQQQRMIVEALPSVGPKIAVELLKKCKSVAGVMRATEKRLVTVDGIGEEKAKKIRELLDAEYSETDSKS